MITPADLAAYMRIPADDHMTVVVEAVNAYVSRWNADPWPDDVTLGATMLAARWHKRRNSPGGVEAFSDMGPTYVSRYDRDLDQLLNIGDWTAPGVA